MAMADTNADDDYTPESSMDTFADHARAASDAQVFEFLEQPRLSGRRWAFRGQRDANRPLTPSIERINSPFGADYIERWINPEFQRRVHHYITDPPKAENRLEWLALMQHHGAPTRLLDWTLSPYVAAFFAMFEQAPQGKHSAVWAIDIEALMARATQMWGEYWPHDPGAAGVRDSSNRLFDPPPPSAQRIVVALQPFRMNQRLTVQQGIFLCPSAVDVGFEIILNEMIEPTWTTEDNRPPRWFYKLTIAPEARRDVLRRLRRMNITYQTLFPGLDGFARSLHTEAELLP
jgi:hypothetical protein